MNLPILLLAFSAQGQELRSELIFPGEPIHNHSSSIVELKDGRFLVCWYRGSGERHADDVTIEAAYQDPKTGKWTPRFTLADTPGFPDTNPVLWVDRDQRLWLFWGLIIANEWHTALLKYYRADHGGLPFNWSDSVILKPARIAERTKEVFAGDSELAKRLRARAEDKYFARMGWFTRTHPIQLASGRIVLPLYSDGYSYSLMGLSDDNGKSWFASEPILGGGGVQPSVVVKKNGELVAYMRDNGPAPKRIQVSASKDQGMSWTAAEDIGLPNPGSSVEAVNLKDGRWLMVYNDAERGRSSLAVSLSDDEGKSWKWTRRLEEGDAGQYHYPSVIQSRDGMIHVTYSYFEPGPKKSESIKHARFPVEWVTAK